MEECKVRARNAGLSFEDESLEYIVTNRDMLELSPKVMIPTLYDYWVHDVEVLKKKGFYKVYPSNPYETVINSRPAISFYNDNNPDWLNIMIFYHVLAHIDFFQNNVLFENTWDDDFVGQALSDKRLIANYRAEYGRWVDYVIEFSRGINNITGFYNKLAVHNLNENMQSSKAIEYYFGEFLQEIKKLPHHEYYKEVERYNSIQDATNETADSVFFSEVKRKYPEFDAVFAKSRETKEETYTDLLKYIHDKSAFLKKDENTWMKSIMSVVRNTALYFEPQIRTKTINEGWASYWHDELFCNDERIKGHEIAYAKINAYVTSISRVGLNPYAIGLRLIQYVEELAEKGKFNINYQENHGIEFRENYDAKTGKGKGTIFNLRDNFSDFTLVNTFVDQDFVDKHNLFVVGKRLDQQRQVYEYYVKSRKAEDYKQMLLDSFYHPPKITVDETKTNEGNLYLVHAFEDKQLVKDFISDTMLGIEFLWGGQVQLETTEIHRKQPQKQGEKPSFEHIRVLYTMKDKKVSKRNL